MNSVMSFYLKQFIRSGAIFAAIEVISNLIMEGTVDPFYVGFQFIFCGLALSVPLTYEHIVQIRNLGYQELSPDILSSKQERTFSSDLSHSEIIHSILNDAVLGKMYLLKKENAILLKSGVTFYSIGTTICIETLDGEEGNYVYEAKSQPRYYLGQPDMGKSLEYITRFEKIMGSTSLVSVTS